MRFSAIRQQRTETLITLLLALLLIPVPADALAQDTSWTSVEAFYDYVDSTADELLDFAIDEDAGELWFTSAGGLVRWQYGADGARHLVTRADGLPASHAFGLTLTPDAVWVATAQGLAKVDRDTLEVLDTWLVGNVTTTVALEDDLVWVGTFRDGAFRLDPATGEVAAVPTGPGGSRLVRDIVVDAEAVWLATDGHGLVRYDRATADVTRHTEADGLPSDNLTSIERTSNLLWVGTFNGVAYADPEAGNWQYLNESSGAPHDRVLDVLFRGTELWISTHRGVSYVDTGALVKKWTYVDHRTGLLSNNVFRMADVGDDEMWFLTGSGVSRWDLRNASMSHFTNLNAIQHARASASTVHEGVLWFSTPSGVSAYDPATDLWTNHAFPKDMTVRGRTTYAIDVAPEGTVWVGTQDGFWAYYPDEARWEKYEDPSRGSVTNTDIFLSLVIDGSDVWLAEFDTGVFRLIDRENAENATWKRYLYGVHGLVDPRVRDVEPTPDGVWITAGDTLHLLDVEQGYVTAAYDSTDLPGERPQKIIPDGKDLWVLTDDAGIYRFNTERREVAEQYSTENGLPSDKVLAAAPSGRHLWVSFQDSGLAAIDLTDGSVNVVPDETLIAPVVLNLLEHNGTVYAGTPNGIQRFDAATFTPLPVLDTAATVSGANGTAGADGAASVRPPRAYITSPLNGDAADDEITVTGRATAASGTVDRVEVRLDNGPWQTAEGTDTWRITLDLTGVEPGTHRVYVRAHQGDLVSAEDLRRIEVLEPPKIPLTITHEPVTDATAGRPIEIHATVRGDPPLTAYVWYRSEGAATPSRIVMQPTGGDAFTATVPASDVTGGELEYYLEAASGRRRATHPAEDGTAHPVQVVAPLQPALTLAAEPAQVAAVTGATSTFKVRLESGADTLQGYTLRVEGRLNHWTGLDDAAVDVPAGGTATRTVTVTVPADALATNDTLSIVAVPHDLAYDAVRLDVPLQVSVATAGPSGDDDARAESPAPALLGLLGAIGLAARARRRWGQ